MKNTALKLALFLFLAVSLAFPQNTFVLRPGQKYTIFHVPPGAYIHVSSGLPVNVYFARCHMDQIIDADIECNYSSDRLIIVDSRARNAWGRNNEVIVSFTFDQQ